MLALFHELFTGDPYKSTPPNGCLPVVVEEKEEKEERREEEEEKMEEMREGKEEGGKQADECRGEELLHTVKPQGPLFNGWCVLVCVCVYTCLFLCTWVCVFLCLN